MDKSLGDILDHLEKAGIAEDTLILFVGDNGSDAPLDLFMSMPVRFHSAKKGTHYEGGMRVPFIASWANHQRRTNSRNGCLFLQERFKGSSAR